MNELELEIQRLKQQIEEKDDAFEDYILAKIEKADETFIERSKKMEKGEYVRLNDILEPLWTVKVLKHLIYQLQEERKNKNA